MARTETIDVTVTWLARNPETGHWFGCRMAIFEEGFTRAEARAFWRQYLVKEQAEGEELRVLWTRAVHARAHAKPRGGLQPRGKSSVRKGDHYFKKRKTAKAEANAWRNN